MNLRNIFVPVGVIGLVLVGYASAGWPGVAAVAGGLVMWALLHFTRLMNVLRRASKRPKGYVGSAVMLNARLKPGVNLMHVMAMTQSLGERLSPADTDPEIYRWTDGTQSHVTCEFINGRLQKWTLERPEVQEPTAAE
jgi:hypothetical protein